MNRPSGPRKTAGLSESVHQEPKHERDCSTAGFIKILQTFYKVCIDNLWVAATYWPPLRVHPKQWPRPAKGGST
jgi:hypothetical protein